MKKLWDTYSYTIIFIAGLFILSLSMIFNNFDTPEDSYKQITAKQGDTIWDMAERFGSTGMSKEEFVSWVQDKNDLQVNQLRAGQTVIIPVENNSDGLQLANSK